MIEDMRSLIVVAAVLVTGAGCGGGSGTGSAPTTTEQTETTTLESTKGVSRAELLAVLIRPGDLPSGLMAGQVRLRPPSMFNGLPSADATATQQFSRSGETAGGVTVLIYPNAAVRGRAYRRLVTDMGGARRYRVLNDSARVATFSLLLPLVDLVFEQCNALVHVRMTGTDEPDDAGSYAASLEGRLEPLVC